MIPTQLLAQEFSASSPAAAAWRARKDVHPTAMAFLDATPAYLGEAVPRAGGLRSSRNFHRSRADSHAFQSGRKTTKKIVSMTEKCPKNRKQRPNDRYSGSLAAMSGHFTVDSMLIGVSCVLRKKGMRTNTSLIETVGAREERQAGGAATTGSEGAGSQGGQGSRGTPLGPQLAALHRGPPVKGKGAPLAPSRPPLAPTARAQMPSRPGLGDSASSRGVRT